MVLSSLIRIGNIYERAAGIIVARNTLDDAGGGSGPAARAGSSHVRRFDGNAYSGGVGRRALRGRHAVVGSHLWLAVMLHLYP